MPNRLAGEKSPYLLQHAENPVDWYPWGDEAFGKAALEDKPIFLSIGYSTCHWCHVMEHESFEDGEVAELLNANFIAVKVDREERPDIDHVYMSVCQATTGSGGWPLSIFMGPDGKPFFAGSYFPKTGRFGTPGFIEMLRSIAGIWKSRRGQLEKIGVEIINAIEPKPVRAGQRTPGRDTLEVAYGQFRQTFDPDWGGFGAAPKFPTPHNLSFLFRWQKREPRSEAAHMAEKTLLAMRSGGIFDQIGFGFHRYSVDGKWLVPHFEKMLYDQALLAIAYTDALLATGKARYARVISEIFEYVMREMKSPEGGFYCAEDADTEGKEGLFYSWTPEQVSKVIGKEAGEVFCRAYGITREGNFEEGMSIPHVPKPIEELAVELGTGLQELESMLEESRQKLFAARESRPHPFKDDKILLSWNGLMIAALAGASRALGDISYAAAAKEAADFALATMRTGSGRLLRRYRQGEVAYPAYADDYAFLIWGLIELYETLFEVKYLAEAVRLQEDMVAIFGGQEGGFYYSGNDGEKMIVRAKTADDGATPSSNSVAALNLLRLAGMTGNPAWEEQADRLIKAFAGQVSLIPYAHTHFLQAVDFAIGPALEIIIAGDPRSAVTQEMISTVNSLYLPNRVLLLKRGGQAGDELSEVAPFTRAMHAGESGPAAFVCKNFKCERPTGNPAELERLIK